MCCCHLLSGEVPYKVTNKETNETKEYNYLGHWDDRDRINPEHGFYTIGASGCGYMFFDNVIHFDNELYKFEYKKDKLGSQLFSQGMEHVEIIDLSDNGQFLGPGGFVYKEDLLNGS